MASQGQTPTRVRMTLEEFMALPESNLRHELIDGILYSHEDDVVSPAAKDEHQRVVTLIVVYLGGAVSGGELRVAPTDVHLGLNVVQPDVFWVLPEGSRAVLGADGYWYGAPDLVIEVASPSTESRDRGNKFTLYEQHGVREYWLVEPEARFVEVFVHTGEQFERQGLYQPGETFSSSLPLRAPVEVSAILGAQTA